MKKLLISAIGFYRKQISPHFPARCKYYPTCSCYAMQAINRFGAFRGSLLAGWRLLRCNRWSMGGIDYVPDKFTFKVEKYNYFSDDSFGESDDFCEDEHSENNERY